MARVVSHEAVFEKSILGRDVIVPAFPALFGDRGLDTQNASGHLAWTEDPAGSIGQEDVLAPELEPSLDRASRDRVPEASFELTDALKRGDADAGDGNGRLR